MSEEAQAINPCESPEVPDGEGSYVAPAQKALTEIIAADTEDESLQRYKAALLGNAASANTGIVVLPDAPRNVIVQKIW